MEPIQRILVLGATSAIARATARLFAERRAAFVLVGRSAERLGAVAEDLAARGAERVETIACDLAELREHERLLADAEERLGGYDAALIAHGELGEQAASEASFEEAERLLRVNFLSFVSLLTHLANRFEREQRGLIAAIGSVAGDRGRQSNYVYGTAKGATALFLQGLRNRLFRSNVRVLTIKPGFVDTPMTAHIEPKGPLFVGPEVVGRGIFRAMVRGRSGEIYLPWFWRLIMLVIRLIPEPIFQRMKL